MDTTAARRGAAMLVALAAALFLAGPAEAYNWGTLYAGNPAVAAGYGTFWNYGNGIRAQNSSYQYQIQNGDNGVFVDTLYSFYGPGSSCGTNQNGAYNVCWHFDTEGQTSRTTTHSWAWRYTADNLEPDASAARGSIKVCEDISWWPDTCSATVIKSFSY